MAAGSSGCGGQCPQNLDDAASLDSCDPVEQTHKVMQNIKQLIEEAGGAWSIW